MGDAVFETARPISRKPQPPMLRRDGVHRGVMAIGQPTFAQASSSALAAVAEHVGGIAELIFDELGVGPVHVGVIEWRQRGVDAGFDVFATLMAGVSGCVVVQLVQVGGVLLPPVGTTLFETDPVAVALTVAV